MMKSTLRSTTALIAALATVTPGLTMAQTAPLAAGQAQAEGQTGAEGKSDPDHGRVSTGAEEKPRGQARQNSCIETQSQNGVSAKAAADLCEGMTASAPGSEAEKRSEDAIQKQARQKAEDSTEEARKAMGGGNAKAAAQDDAANDTAQAKPAAKGTAKAEVTTAPGKDAEAKSGVQKQAQTDEDTKPRAQEAATGETPSEGGKVDALKRKLEGKTTDGADKAQDNQAQAKEPSATKAASDAQSADAGAADKGAADAGPSDATPAQARADADAKADMPAEEKSADRDMAPPSPQQSAEEEAPNKANGRTDPDSLAKALAGKEDAPDADVKPEAKADADAQAQADTQAAPEPRDPQAADAGTKDAQPKSDDAAKTDDAAKANESRRVEEALAATEDAQKRASEGAPVKNEALAAEAEMPRDGDAKAAPADDPKMTEEVITKENARSSNEDFTTAVNAKAQDRDRDDKDEGLSDFEKVAIAGLGALAVGAILNNGSEVAVNSGDRVVVQNPDGSYGLIKDDNALLRQPGARISTRNYDDGSTRTITRREDGAQIVTVYDAQRRIVQRTRIEPDGTRYVLIDDSQGAEPVRVSDLPRANFRDVSSTSDEDALRDALARSADTDRGFTLSQVRQIADVRDLAPAISVENVTFETGSAAIRPAQAEELSQLGEAIKARIDDNPREIFLIEGHTDAIGNAAYNLALSDRRAESMALALTEYFDIPPENLVVQGYGEEYLKVDTQGASEENRRVTVRRVTDLLRVASN
ncbi:OmpA family protein [Thioclava sp. 'Guangxiensis']|uniref:OmpA family protein n=1 Tax=Thioclava sp. 'Guangxiensis' TaxID=3149044 RepID=UPI003878007C